MTRRDFEAIAAVLKTCKPMHLDSDPNDTREAFDVWACTIDRLVMVLAASNPRFDRARFIKACGA